MKKATRVSILPAVMAVSALFLVLEPGGADATIEIVQAQDVFGYSPERVRLEPGARVAFVNRTRSTHTATCNSLDPAAGACTWDSGDIRPGQTVFVTLPARSESFTFTCRYHGRVSAESGAIDAGTPDPQATPQPTAQPTAGTTPST